MKSYLYFPGCSLKGTGGPYEQSLLAVFRKLGLSLVELDDWNCCGATAYLSVDGDLATVLAARNLALAEKAGGTEVVAPCSGCFLGLSKANATLEEYPELRSRVARALGEGGLAYSGGVRIRHPLEVLMHDLGPEALRRQVTRPLRDFPVAPYYGCAVLRPYGSVDDMHTPRILEDLIRVTGATAVDYPNKSRCCGGMLTSGVPSVGLRLVEILLESARAGGAEAVVTTCPLCQYNLECYQDRLEKASGRAFDLPVVYFTQLLGLALGIPGKELGLDRLLRAPHLEVKA
jgi:heterodisulfide reductase subunit B